MSACKEEMLSRASTPNATFMRIMQHYDFRSDGVFLIVEGKDDSTYYERVARDKCGAEKRSFSTIVAGNKYAVTKTHSLINWNRYNRKRILFFVDRDYSDFLEDEVPCNESNLYVTDGYSIENSVFNEYSAIGLARRSCSGDSLLDPDDEDEIRKLYWKAVEEAEKVLVPITACQIIWQRTCVSFNAERFEPKHYFNAKEGVIEAIPRLDVEMRAVEREFGLPECCCVASAEDHKTVIESVVSSGGYMHAARGKYRMRMFCFWMRSLKDRVFPSGVRIKPGKVLGDVLAEAMAVTPAPKSLLDFIDSNLGSNP